jgi:Skp family chaperone for outer membrane proteins
MTPQKGNTTMKTFALVGLAALALTAACAPGPDSIAPVSMGNAFADMSCQQAAANLAAERQTTQALAAKQRGAQIGDAVGVFLIAVPVSSLTGGNVAGDLGMSKGKVAALEARLASC